MTLLLLFLQIPNFQIRSLSGDGNDGGICGICVPKTLGIGGGGGGGGGGGREGGRSRNYVKSWTEDFFSLCNATIHTPLRIGTSHPGCFSKPQGPWCVCLVSSSPQHPRPALLFMVTNSIGRVIYTLFLYKYKIPKDSSTQ